MGRPPGQRQSTPNPSGPCVGHMQEQLIPIALLQDHIPQGASNLHPQERPLGRGFGDPKARDANRWANCWVTRQAREQQGPERLSKHMQGTIRNDA